MYNHTLILLAIIIWSPDIGKNDIAEIMQEIETDRQFMTEVIMLEEAVLSNYCMFASEESEEYSDDEFLEFIAPLETDRNSVSYKVSVRFT